MKEIEIVGSMSVTEIKEIGTVAADETLIETMITGGETETEGVIEGLMNERCMTETTEAVAIVARVDQGLEALIEADDIAVIDILPLHPQVEAIDVTVTHVRNRLPDPPKERRKQTLLSDLTHHPGKTRSPKSTSTSILYNSLSSEGIL